MFNLFRYPIFFFGTCLSLFISDRLGKYIAQNFLNGVESVTTPILTFGYYQNNGIGFGLPLDKTIALIVIIIIIIAAAIWLVLILPYKQVMSVWGVSLIIVGAVSNLIDRLIYRQVIDYIKLFNWSIFNLADVLIVSGAILIIVGWKKYNRSASLQRT